MNFVACVTHPFSEEAEGGQWPDEYSLPTATQVLRTSFTVSLTDTTGELDIVVQPNPFCMIANGNGTASTSPHITGGNTWSSHPYTGGFYEYGLCTEDQLGSFFARYRVVGWGVRFRNLQPPLNQQGKFYAAKVPSLNQFANYSTAYTPKASWQNYLQFYELPNSDPSTGYVVNQIIGLPTAMENMVSALSIAGGLEVVGKVTSPVCQEWRDSTNVTVVSTTDEASPLMQSGQVLFQTNANTGQPYPVSAFDSDFLRQGGWSVLVIKATGLPNSPQAVFDLEAIMHLEGIPPVGQTIVFSPCRAPIVHGALRDAALNYASKLPTFRRIVHAHGHVKSALGGVSRFLGFHDFGHMLSTMSLNPGNAGKLAATGLEIAGAASLL